MPGLKRYTSNCRMLNRQDFAKTAKLHHQMHWPIPLLYPARYDYELIKAVFTTSSVGGQSHNHYRKS